MRNRPVTVPGDWERFEPHAQTPDTDRGDAGFSWGSVQRLRFRGAWVGACPCCGDAVRVRWDQEYTGLAPVRCRGCGEYAEANDYREALNG